MELSFIKTAGGFLIPSDDETTEALQSIANNSYIKVEYKKKRNLRFHRKVFALLKLILDNQGHYKTVDNVLEMVKFKAGYFETMVTHKGKKHYKTTSIAFDKMDEIEFGKFYQAALTVGYELCGTYDFEKQLAHFA